VEVFTPGNTFSPFTANVSVGGVVRFHIFGDDHNVIFTPGTAGAPQDINVVRDVTVDRTFTKAGDYAYSCTVHPGMNGEIIVR
jgi:plastocyanin